MDLQMEKDKLIKLIEQIQHPELIVRLREFISNETADKNLSKEYVIREEMIRRAKNSKKAIEEGRVLSMEEFRKKNTEWLKGHYGR